MHEEERDAQTDSLCCRNQGGAEEERDHTPSIRRALQQFTLPRLSLSLIKPSPSLLPACFSSGFLPTICTSPGFLGSDPRMRTGGSWSPLWPLCSSAVQKPALGKVTSTAGWGKPRNSQLLMYRPFIFLDSGPVRGCSSGWNVD